MTGAERAGAVLVTGGAGRLGQLVVTELLARGAAVRVVGRRERPDAVPPEAEYHRADLLSGAGLARAVQGVGSVIHLASDPLHPADDVQAAGRLWAALPRQAVRQVLYISIVGIEAMQGYGYYRAKLAVERSLAGSGLPYSIQRATQFHDFVADELLARLALGPFLLTPPGIRLQPVETAAVARQVAQAALAPATGRLPDLAGPELRSLAWLAGSWRRAGAGRGVLLPLPLPMPVFRAWQAGRATSPEAHTVGRPFQDWLTARG